MIPINERIKRMLRSSGYIQSKTRDIRFEKYIKPGKPNVWVGERGALYTGKTIKTAINITPFIEHILKRFNA